MSQGAFLICSEILLPLFVWYSFGFFFLGLARTEKPTQQLFHHTRWISKGCCPQPCLPRLQTVSNFSCSMVRCCLVLAKQRQHSVHILCYSSLFLARARYTEVVGRIVFGPVEVIRKIFSDSSYRCRECPLPILRK